MYCTLQYSLGFDNPKGFEIPFLSDAASVRGGRGLPSTGTLAAEGIGIMNLRRQQERHERADPPKSQARVGRQVVQRATVGQTAKSAPSRPRRYYLAQITDAGSVPCSTTNHKGLDSLQALFSCLKSPRHAGLRPMGLRMPSCRSARKSAFFRRFPRPEQSLSLFCLRVGAASNRKNQPLTRAGSSSTKASGQASNPPSGCRTVFMGTYTLPCDS